MTKVRTILDSGFALLILALVSVPVSADYLYRYVNADGVVVINHSIPPEFVRNGYEILNADGTQHEVVERTLTEEELADQSGEAYQMRVAEEEAARLRAWDESLLLRYSTIEDIEAARERALGELKIRINIMRGNLRSLQRQVENNQQRAADIERGGGHVPVAIISTIDAQLDEIVETERSINERLREMDYVEEGYNRDIDRFGMLLDTVALRQRRSRGLE